MVRSYQPEFTALVLKTLLLHIKTTEIRTSPKTPTPPDPFERLPVELLSDIFVAAYALFPTTIKHKFPANLLRCCRRWNSIARDTADLWTHIRVSGRKDAALATEFACRARDRPLFIIIDTFYSDPPPAAFRVMTRALDPWLPRCRSLRISTGQSVLFDQTMVTSLPASCELVVKHFHSTHKIRFSQQLALRSVHLIKTLVDWGSWAIEGLEELRLIGCRDPIWLQDLRRIFGLSPMLRILHVDLRASDIPIRGGEPVKLEHLYQAALYLDGNGRQVDIADIVEAPKLQRLAVRESLAHLGLLGGLLYSVNHILLDRCMLESESGSEVVAKACPNVRHVGTRGQPFPLGGSIPQFSQLFPLAETYTIHAYGRHFLREFLRDTAALKAVNLPISNIGLPPYSSEADFGEHEALIGWLRGRYEVGVFGAVGRMPLYRSWRDLQDGRPITESDIRLDEQDLWTNSL